MGSERLHEREEDLDEATCDMHRALVSLKEELEAVDWYQQRARACHDAELRAVLLHNEGEEIEHAMMVLEWIRRHDATFDAHIATYLRSTGPIVDVEKRSTTSASPNATAKEGASVAAAPPSLGIGSLKGAK